MKSWRLSSWQVLAFLLGGEYAFLRNFRLFQDMCQMVVPSHRGSWEIERVSLPASVVDNGRKWRCASQPVRQSPALAEFVFCL